MLKKLTPRVRKAKGGLVAYTRAIQYILEGEVEKSFGLASFGLNEKNKHIPLEDLENTITYESLQPDGSVDSFSFIYHKGPIIVGDHGDNIGEDNNKITLNVVVYGTGDKYYVEEAEKIKSKLAEIKDFKVEKVYLNGKDAYLDFSGVDTKDRFFYAPHYCFRFEGELIYPNLMPDCFHTLPYLVQIANKIE